MKWLKTLPVIISSAAIACGSDPSGPSAIFQRYDLTSLLGQTPPIALGAVPELATGLLCQQTLHSQYIQLSKPNSAKLVTDMERACEGRAPMRGTTTSSGSFTQAGDTLRLTFHVGGLVGNYSVAALSEPNRLKIITPIYTEADPDGSSGQVAYTIYEAR